MFTFWLIILIVLMAAWCVRIVGDQILHEAEKRIAAENEYWRKMNEKYALCSPHDMRWVVWTPQFDPYKDANYYGLINHVCKKCGYTVPMTCSHGGSMYMDRACYELAVEWIRKEEQNLFLDQQMPFGE